MEPEADVLNEEIKLNEEIDTAITEGLNLEQITEYLDRLDSAISSPVVDEMRDKLLAAQDQLMG